MLLIEPLLSTLITASVDALMIDSDVPKLSVKLTVTVISLVTSS